MPIRESPVTLVAPLIYQSTVSFRLLGTPTNGVFTSLQCIIIYINYSLLLILQYSIKKTFTTQVHPSEYCNSLLYHLFSLTPSFKQSSFRLPDTSVPSRIPFSQIELHNALEVPSVPFSSKRLNFLYHICTS